MNVLDNQPQRNRKSLHVPSVMAFVVVEWGRKYLEREGSHLYKDAEEARSRLL